nr:hypothetical protein [Tanacetum cinerariifolium]
MHSNDMTCFKELASHLRSLYQNSFVHVGNPKRIEIAFLRFFVDASLVVTESSRIESENNSSENALSKSVNETQMQMQEVKVDIGKALDVGLVVTESSRTELDKQDTSSRSWNGITYAVDADIRPVYDQVPFVE